MLLGVLDNSAPAGKNPTSAGTTYNPAVATHYFGWYVQDDWNPLPKLTLNLGIRYEIQTAPTYRHNVSSVFNPNAPNPIGEAIGETLPGALQFLSSSSRSSYNTNFGNVAPRIGFTYQVSPKFVARGGYGIFYPPSISCCFETESAGFASTTVSPVTLNTISPNPAVTVANPWPNGYIPITGNSLGELQQVGNGVTSNFKQRKSSYVQQYLLGWQYGFTPNDRLDVNYVGNHGVHIITGNLNRSQVNPTYLSLGTVGIERPGPQSLLWTHRCGNQLLRPRSADRGAIAVAFSLSAVLLGERERRARRLLQLQRIAGQLQPPLQSRVDCAGLLHLLQIPRQCRGQQPVVVLRQSGPGKQLQSGRGKERRWLRYPACSGGQLRLSTSGRAGQSITVQTSIVSPMQSLVDGKSRRLPASSKGFPSA